MDGATARRRFWIRFWARTPALLPAAALLAGTRLGLGAEALAPAALIALALAGAAWGGRAGVMLLAAALGLANGHLRGEEGPRAWWPVAERTVAASVVVSGHPRRLDDVWSAPVRIERLSQGERIRARPFAAYLHLPAPEREDGIAKQADKAAGLLAPGSRLRVLGQLSRPVRLGNDPPPRDGPWRLKVKSPRLVRIEGAPGRVGRLAEALRRPVERVLTAERTALEPAGAPGLGRPLARALLLGDTAGMPPAVLRGLRRSGLAHLLAVSGLHVALVAGMALLLARPLPRPLRFVLALSVVGLYVLLVGPRPSLLRAGAMAFLMVAALLAERPPVAANALAIAAGGIALVDPGAVVDLGFQLTVGATAGLVLVSPVLAARWTSIPGAPGWLARPVAATVGAQLGTLPFALPAFSLASPLAPLLNLVAVPWAGAALSAAIVWTGLALALPGAAAAALPALDALAAPVALPAVLPQSPWLGLPWSAGALEAALLAMALMALAAAFGRRPAAPARALAIVGGLGLLLLGGVELRSVRDDALRPLELVMIDVGQGDAILLRDGPRSLLVDGGGWPAGDLGGRVLLPTLARRGLRRLDGMLLTHPDRDHCGGLVEIAGYLPVGWLAAGPGALEEGSGECAAELAAASGDDRRVVAAGDAWKVGRWRLSVLHPASPEAAAGGDGEGRGGRRGGHNDASVVLLAEGFGRRVLLTGDVEAAGERALVRAGLEARLGGRIDVLKVAHHGSKTSSSAALLAATRPRLALVSAGARNPYGHPAPVVLERLASHGARVLRTDRDGMVLLRFWEDGRWDLELPGQPK